MRTRANELLRNIEESARRRSDLHLDRHPLHYGCGSYELVRIASKDIESVQNVVLIQAGLHGDEVAGPITLARHLDEIADEAHARGLGLIIYPLTNPSGFDEGSRYNADGDHGPFGNGDLIRYLLDDGTVADEVPEGGEPRWRWSGDPGMGAPPPLETRVLQSLLRREPLSRVVGALDLHQDCLTPGLGPAAYHYGFGDFAVYGPIVDALRELTPILSDTVIGAGFGGTLDAQGEPVPRAARLPHPRSDENGFVVRHDGSLTDLFWRMGARFSVAVETTQATPLDLACVVNMVWIRGVIALSGDQRA